MFQLVVNGEAVLIYAGRTERDADRYLTMHGADLVFQYQGDVLSRCGSDTYVIEARPGQVSAWSDAFVAAVECGDADRSDPAAFALQPGLAK